MLISSNQKRSIVAILKTLLTLAFIGAGVIYVLSQRADFQALNMPSATAVFVVAAGYIVSVFFRSLYNAFTARRLGASLSITESFMLSAVVTASNYVLPMNAGAAFRAYYMQRVHAFPLGYFASATVVSFIITVLLMSSFAMVLLVLIYLDLGYFRLDLFIVLPVLAGTAGAGLLLRGDESQADNDEEQSLWGSFRSGYLDLVKDTRLVYVSLLLVIANFVVASAVWTVALRDYAPEIATTEAMLLSASQIVSGLITLTPGAAGFQELVGLYVGASFSATTVQLFAVLVWVRLVRVLTSLLVAAPCAIALRRKS
ncbi:MAG: flippase-like domain-containing protein [Proteobacteria bacterium]|nr:flippase-like domain-containing protein [Pseudomonadota bacterium]